MCFALMAFLERLVIQRAIVNAVIIQSATVRFYIVQSLLYIRPLLRTIRATGCY
jgi:hypothetical protein